VSNAVAVADAGYLPTRIRAANLQHHSSNGNSLCWRVLDEPTGGYQDIARGARLKISRAEKRSAHSQPMSELAQRRELREAEKLEGVVLRRFAFQRTDDERAGKAPAEAHALGLVKIVAAPAFDVMRRRCDRPDVGERPSNQLNLLRIPHLQLKPTFPSSSPTCPAMQSVSVGGKGVHSGARCGLQLDGHLRRLCSVTSGLFPVSSMASACSLSSSSVDQRRAIWAGPALCRAAIRANLPIFFC